MENIDYIKKLEEANITLITSYLEDNYVIQHNTFVNKHTSNSEWGYNIVHNLEIILSLDYKYITELIKSWVHSKGMFEDKWDNAYMSTVLKTIHYPSKIVELERILGANAEKQMVALLSEKLVKELDNEILKLLKKKVTTFGEFENLMKCLGYVITETVYNTRNFEAERHIISTTEYDKINEQQNNPYWKDWFRARRQNEKT